MIDINDSIVGPWMGDLKKSFGYRLLWTIKKHKRKQCKPLPFSCQENDKDVFMNFLGVMVGFKILLCIKD